MIRFYYHPSPNPLKIALLLEEANLPYEVVPSTPRRASSMRASFAPSIQTARRLLSSTRKVRPEPRPASLIRARSFSTSATRLSGSSDRLAIGPSSCPGYSSSHRDWGPFSGQAVHFQHAAPERLPYAVNRYRREAERHYQILDKHMAGRDTIVGSDYTIVDMSAWGWLDRAGRVLPGETPALAAFPNLQRWFKAIDARPAAARARAIGTRFTFKREVDEETRRALFPSNYPPPAE